VGPDQVQGQGPEQVQEATPSADTAGSAASGAPAGVALAGRSGVRLRATLRMEELDDEFVVLDAPSGMVYRLEGPAAAVIRVLRGDPHGELDELTARTEPTLAEVITALAEAGILEHDSVPA